MSVPGGRTLQIPGASIRQIFKIVISCKNSCSDALSRSLKRPKRPRWPTSGCQSCLRQRLCAEHDGDSTKKFLALGEGHLVAALFMRLGESENEASVGTKLETLYRLSEDMVQLGSTTSKPARRRLIFQHRLFSALATVAWQLKGYSWPIHKPLEAC